MALFPNLATQYYDEKDRSILRLMEHFYSESISINQAFWTEADIDTRFIAGDQTVWNDIYGNLPANQRRQFSFNRIRRVVNMIGGHQRRNRKSTIVVPVENGDAKTADQFTKIMMWIHQQDSVLETISDAFHGALVTGMNLLQVWVDYRSDPVSGNIKVDNCTYNSFLIDPFFRKADLSDCNGIWKRSYLTKSECLSLLPDYVEEIEGLVGNNNRDGKFQFLPESYNFDVKKLLSYDEFYYRTYRTQLMLIDSETGETLEWKSDNKERLEDFLRYYPQIKLQKQEVPTVNLAIIVQGKVIYNDINPLGTDTYPFIPVFTYYEPQMPYFNWRIQGVVRGLRDAQYLYNRRKAIELDILESQVNSGWIYKENALVNPKDVFLPGQGRGIALKSEAQMTDVQQIQSPAIPPATIELSKILAQEIQEISGINEELLGSATDEKAGILSMLRQGAGLTTLQGIFDQLDRAQKLLGKLMIQIIQNNFTPGKVKRIIEEEPTAQFYNKAFGRYDAAVEEGINTTTQRQMQFAQLLHLKEIGVPIPDEVIVEATTLQDKSKLIETLKGISLNQQKTQEMQTQIAMGEQQARTELAQARAKADTGLGIERISRVEENQALAVERRAEAVKDREVALLNMIRALKEIDTIDLQNLEKLIALTTVLKGEEQSTTEQSTIAQSQTERKVQQPPIQPVSAGR